ncbi:hypothetical protein SAMN04488500_11731 [Sporomusa malonica]|uniref:Uncharacterized protein n=2 Tax=Sporomusa malonica TaxID=112901 RepID=A0A1W2DQ61_9FIRM|nr:hypothetical protein SAMN04488500_11731 [Sporomusa malonica]
MCGIWRSYFYILSIRVVRKMQQLVAFLPVFIIFAFPLLYFGGHLGSSVCSAAGILVLFLGMSGPLIKRMI